MIEFENLEAQVRKITSEHEQQQKRVLDKGAEMGGSGGQTWGDGPDGHAV